MTKMSATSKWLVQRNWPAKNKNFKETDQQRTKTKKKQNSWISWFPAYTILKEYSPQWASLYMVTRCEQDQHYTACYTMWKWRYVVGINTTSKFVHREPVFKNLYSTEYALLWFLTHAHISHLAHLLQRFKTFTCHVKLPQMDLVKLTLHAVNNLYNQTWTTCTTTAEQALSFCTDCFTKFQPIHTHIFFPFERLTEKKSLQMLLIADQ